MQRVGNPDVIRGGTVAPGWTPANRIFDLAPGKSEKFQAQLEHWKDFVGCKGKFDDRDFPYRSIDLSLSPHLRQ